MSKDAIKLHYACIADSWSSKLWAKSRSFNAAIAAFVDTTGHERSLDVGIGAGDLEDFMNMADVTGVDLSANMLRRCLKRHPAYKLCIGDAENLPFNDESFDFVFCRNLLQNFDYPQKAFGEMYRVLMVGGKLAVIESAVCEHERQYVTDIVRVIEPDHPLFPSHEQLRGLFEDIGVHRVEQSIESLHGSWLSDFCESKKVSQEQRGEIISICRNLPEWYSTKYEMSVDSASDRIDSTLTFSFIRGIK
ncbi:MAG: hypothetical protein A2Z75_04125 [Chloroflexi bacterium RBG_13_50_10]|nr:MAG: hypothetical protein A2Z75_04125 [Chloroflexi bacterium RBG_13_50_10]